MRTKHSFAHALSLFLIGLLTALGQCSTASAGRLVAWGFNAYGQADVPAGDDYVAVATGYYHSLALKADGSLVAWGYDDSGQVSDVPTGNDFVAIAGGGFHNVALKSDGSVVDWGGTFGASPAGNDFVAVSAGLYHSLALKSDGSLVGWGDDYEGQTSGVPTGNDFVAIAAGLEFNAALKSDGSLVAWGYLNLNVPAGNDYVAIAAGRAHVLALKPDGSVDAFGSNTDGQTNVPAGNDYVAIAAGRDHSLALKSDGTIVGWGSNQFGQQDIPARNDFHAIATGRAVGHVVALVPEPCSLVLLALGGLVMPLFGLTYRRRQTGSSLRPAIKSQIGQKGRLMRPGTALACLFLTFYCVSESLAGGIVYMGVDPATATSDLPDAQILIGNAARWAGGSLDPVIAHTDPAESGGGFNSEVATRLSNEGFTNLTQVSSASLATLDLSVFDVLYIGPTTDQTAVDNLNSAANNIQTFVEGGGGLVVEPQVWVTGAWSWVPFAALIGHSGSTNFQTEAVTIVDAGHPIMSGLTSAGLSNWGISVHSNFSTPSAAGFSVLAVDGGGVPVIIAIAIPEPSTFALLALGLALFLRRRRP